MIDKHTYVLAELKRRHWQLSNIAKECKISYRTVYNLMHGKGVRTFTLDVLYEFLKNNKYVAPIVKEKKYKVKK